MPFTLAETNIQPPDAPEDLNELLLQLTEYGSPRVSLISEGWFAALELNTNSKGFAGKISSEYDHPTPLNAVMQLRDRLEYMVKEMATLTSKEVRA